MTVMRKFRTLPTYDRVALLAHVLPLSSCFHLSSEIVEKRKAKMESFLKNRLSSVLDAKETL